MAKQGTHVLLISKANKFVFITKSTFIMTGTVEWNP